MFNMDIRGEIKQVGLFQYQVAEKMGMCEMTLIRKLRKELPLDEKAKIREVINQLIKDR